jgi:DNA-binding transcriptional ArsR family regulator
MPTSAASATRKDFVDVELMKALSDELRVEIYAYLCEHVAGSKEVSEALGVDRGIARHHMNVLRDGGWIDAAADVPGREVAYRAVRQIVIPAAVWDRLPEAVQQQVAFRMMRALFGDVAESMEAGFFFRPGRHLSVTPMVVDAEGQREVKELLESNVGGLANIQRLSNDRMTAAGRSNGQAVSLTVGLIGFESLRDPAEGAKASLTKRL